MMKRVLFSKHVSDNQADAQLLVRALDVAGPLEAGWTYRHGEWEATVQHVTYMLVPGAYIAYCGVEFTQSVSGWMNQVVNRNVDEGWEMPDERLFSLEVAERWDY